MYRATLNATQRASLRDRFRFATNQRTFYRDRPRFPYPCDFPIRSEDKGNGLLYKSVLDCNFTNPVRGRTTLDLYTRVISMRYQANRQRNINVRFFFLFRSLRSTSTVYIFGCLLAHTESNGRRESVEVIMNI